MEKQEGRPKWARSPWNSLLTVALLTLLVLSGFALYQRYQGYAEAQVELIQADRERDRQKTNLQELQARVDQADTPFQMERLARNMGMVKPGETIYRIPDNMVTVSGSPTPMTSVSESNQITTLSESLERTWRSIVDFFRSLAR
jgi:cell division protein FtsB